MRISLFDHYALDDLGLPRNEVEQMRHHHIAKGESKANLHVVNQYQRENYPNASTYETWTQATCNLSQFIVFKALYKGFHDRGAIINNL